MVAALIREGHSDIMSYGFSFFDISVQELETHKRNTVVDAAFATRIASAKNEDWTSFVSGNTEKIKPPTKPKRIVTESEHDANIRYIKGLK